MTPSGTIVRASVLLGLILVVTVANPTPANGDLEDFEGHGVGTLPSPPWQDVGLVDPQPPNPPDPSAMVEVTGDALGRDTQALSVVEAIAESQGIYRMIPVSPYYVVTADIRVDRFSDDSGGQDEDWAMEVGTGEFVDGLDPAYWA